MDINTQQEEHGDQTSKQAAFWFTVKTYGGEHNVQSRQYYDLLESVEILKAKVSSQKYKKVKLCLHHEGRILILCNQTVEADQEPSSN